ncbi:DUF6233 domain-containing protein [Streptomyces sp. NPDC101117]|uniref:DUF6233 domain-containing protein n=1 Tax=Streptomyces sp. NPDC101117 TaxID=3366108 RepID=UPI0037F41ACE
MAALQLRQAEEESGRRRRPRPPEWIVELGIGADRSPVQVHAGDCHMAGQRRRAVSRDEARRLLATGLEGCGHCRPAARLHIIELSTSVNRLGVGRHGRHQWPVTFGVWRVARLRWSARPAAAARAWWATRDRR